MRLSRFLLGLASALALILTGCSPSGPATAGSTGEARSAPVEAAEPKVAPAVAPAVVVAPPGHPEVRVEVEIARTPRQIQRGLMYRQHLPADHGMLFLMRQERVHSFWMHNTLIPLDIIFIGRDMTVAGISANAEPMTNTSRRVDAPSYYVLEVNAGWAAEHHVEAGTPVRFVDVEE